jgi:glycosyltransferase involved in cell wall biosynthesis
MRILYVIPYHPTPSSFIFSKRQVSDVQRSGQECEIFYLNTKFNIVNYVKEWFRFQKTIQGFKPDIIHAQYGTITALFSTLFNSIPFVVTFQGSDINDTKDVHPLRNRIGKWMSYAAARRAKKIICVSEDLYKRLKYGKDKTEVIPSGIDINIFKPLDTILCKQKIQLDVKVKYIFFNANNPIIKRLDIAKEVICLLKDYDVELLSLSGSVPPDDIPIYINASALVLLCSDSEGSPMVVKEALACNVPIVSVDVGDVKARIEGVNYCYITEQDSGKLADAVKEILNRPGCRSNGRERLIHDGIDSESIIRKLLHIYKSIV